MSMSWTVALRSSLTIRPPASRSRADSSGSSPAISASSYPPAAANAAASTSTSPPNAATSPVPPVRHSTAQMRCNQFRSGRRSRRMPHTATTPSVASTSAASSAKPGSSVQSPSMNSTTLGSCSARKPALRARAALNRPSAGNSTTATPHAAAVAGLASDEAEST